MTTYRNTLVLKAFEKKSKKQDENPAIRAKATLPRGHPLSAHSLSRNNVPRELLEVVESDHVYASKAGAKKEARRLLARRDAVSLNVEFDCLPVPHLEPGDLVEVSVEGEGRRVFTMKAWSIPLLPGSMAWDTIRNVTPRRRHR